MLNNVSGCLISSTYSCKVSHWLCHFEWDVRGEHVNNNHSKALKELKLERDRQTEGETRDRNIGMDVD